MKTKTIKLYEFDELPEDIKSEVIDKNRYINTEDFEWYDFAFEEWEDKLKELGFENPNISYTGFYCQGDGASFTSDRVDVELFLAKQKAKGRFKELLKAAKGDKLDLNASVVRTNHQYSHEYTVSVDTEIVYYKDLPSEQCEILEKQEGELRGLILEVVRTLSRKIYKELEKEYEYLTSDELVIDTIKANEYTFRSNGEMEN